MANLVKVTLDESLDAERYKDFLLPRLLVLYCNIKNVRLSESGYQSYELEGCLLQLPQFHGYPVEAHLNIYSSSTKLYCEWDHEDEDGLNYIEAPVRLEFLN